MATVSYSFQYEYAYDADGKRFPRLELRASNPLKSVVPVDLRAYLDSGAERSLFNGWIGAVLGIDVLKGPRLIYETGAGTHLSATIHPVRLSHPDLGEFDIEVGFSSGEVPRNLLGRDFFDLVQIGFREHHLTFYVTPSP